MTFTVTDGTSLGAIAEGIFYGAYIVLFILYLVLRRRNSHMVNRPLTLAHTLLFGLCTLFFCLDISGDYLDVVPDAIDSVAVSRVSVGSTTLLSVIDYLAQMILLYRCWIIWDKRWVVVAVPGFLALVSLGAGLALVVLTQSLARTTLTIGLGIAAFSISLCVNALTTSMIVIRIFLISREARPALGSHSHRSFCIVTAMLIESGFLILASQTVFIVLFSIPGQAAAFCFVQGPITHIYGITPTLLSIRVAMGSAYDNTTRAGSLKISHSEGAATETVDTSMITFGVQTQWAIDKDRAAEI
ncbi:hypothetical protein BD779DRAFT_1545096 [Infundibulicybe gibba]|nr:hypothetical protein BD779DRAFT_1545096 [Infundibulicybe gibba]